TLFSRDWSSVVCSCDLLQSITRRAWAIAGPAHTAGPAIAQALRVIDCNESAQLFSHLRVEAQPQLSPRAAQTGSQIHRILAAQGRERGLRMRPEIVPNIGASPECVLLPIRTFPTLHQASAQAAMPCV